MNRAILLLFTVVFNLAPHDFHHIASTVTTSSNLLAPAQVSEMQDIVTQASNRSLFGGLVGDPLTHVVTIYVAQGSSTLSQAQSLLASIGSTSDPNSQSEPKQWSVTFVFTDTTLATLDGVLIKVQTAEPWQKDVDPLLVGYAIDPAVHEVRVFLTSVSTVLQAEAQQTFDGMVVLDTMQPFTDDSGPTGQQQIDTQPYYGGDQLEGICTAGFAAYNPATNSRGMITAGHCFGQSGVGIYQGTGSVQTGIIGELSIRSYGNNLPDSEFLDATSPFGKTVDPQVNTSMLQGQPVITTGTSWIGMNVCLDGSFTGENCTGTVQRVNFCALGSDGYMHCGLDEVTNATNLPTMCQRGDSGGPLYTTYSGTSIEAFGIVEGANNGHDCFDTEIGPIVSQLGTPLLTTSFQVPSPSASNILSPNATLSGGSWLSSEATQSGVTVWKYTLNMQGDDGNLVLYSPSGVALWNSRTQVNPGAHLVMQGSDGNLVVYSSTGVPLWWSNTQVHPGAYLNVQGDGNLVVYTSDGHTALWSSNTCCVKA